MSDQSPSLDSPRLIDERSERALELRQVLEVMARFAVTDLGAERIRSLRPLRAVGAETEWQELELRRQRLREAAAVLAGGATLASALGEPIAPLLEALGDVRTLPAEVVPRLVTLARAGCRSWRVALSAGGADGEPAGETQEAPGALEALARGLLSTDDIDRLERLAATADRILDARGAVRDDASPELRRCRQRARDRRDGLHRRFEAFVRDHRHQLAGETVSSREGRLSVLLPAGSRGRLDGIVLSRSATGRSFYFEPIELVEGNNELQAAIAAEDAERRRLLAEVSAAVEDAADALLRAADLLSALDALQAVQRFAGVTATVLPEWAAAEPPRLLAARHPLIDPALRAARAEALGVGGQSERCVPLDLDFEDGRVLVITGPNAGGKTVALKTLGLLLLMAHCGLPIPASRRSRLPRLARVVAVVGDEQDLLAEQSTFSAHLRRLDEVWRLAGPDVLALVDEVAAGTNPEEGAALAVPLLEHLVLEGGFAAITTHLVEVAAAAYRLEGASSLATELDAQSGTPTFRLRAGPPEGSHAIDLARRLGLESAWLEGAEARLSDELRDLHALLAEAHALRTAAGEERERLATAARDQETLNRRLAEELERSKSERRALRRRLEQDLARFKRDVEAKLDAEAARVRSRLETAPRLSRKARTRAVRSSAERLFEAAPDLAPAAEETPADAVVDEGSRVRHRALGWEGTVVRLDDQGAEVSVRGKRLRCPVAQLLPVAESTSERRRQSQVSLPAAPEGAGELHLIGERIEEALERLDRYLDQAVHGNADAVRIVHGHGSGRLRAAVREYLRAHPAVERHAPAPPNEGGDGATVVILRGA